LFAHAERHAAAFAISRASVLANARSPVAATMRLAGREARRRLTSKAAGASGIGERRSGVNAMATTRHELRQEIERSLEELQTMRDEIRVRMHLASMEAKDKWNELEPSLEKIEEQIKEATQKFHDSLAELKTAFRSLRDKLP
jgi:uncharacterized protein YPO0396